MPITQDATPQTLQVLEKIATAYEYQWTGAVREARVKELPKARIGDKWKMLYRGVHFLEA